MKLYTSPTSPFARKVQVALIETGLDANTVFETVTVSPFAPGETVPAANPLGKIPALERDGDSALFDSRVITRYVDNLAPGILFPTGAALWETLVLEATADGIQDAAVLMTYEQRIRPADKQFPEWLDAQWLKIGRALDMLETSRMTQLNGSVDLGVLAIAIAIDYVDFRHDLRNWRATRPALAAWHAAISPRPSLASTRPRA